LIILIIAFACFAGSIIAILLETQFFDRIAFYVFGISEWLFTKIVDLINKFK